MLTFLLWQDGDLFGFRHLSSDQSSVECNSSVNSDFSLTCAFHICLSCAPPSGQSGTQAVVCLVLRFQAYSVLCRVRSMDTQNAGEPRSLIDFSPHSLPLCYISGTFQSSRAFMVVWPENWDFFVGPCCVFPTTAPITEATNGRKRNKPK